MNRLPTASEVQAYFQTAFSAFKRAVESAAEPESHFYQLGKMVIRLQFAGPQLVPKLTLALQHLKTGPVVKPDLTIGIWDGKSTGVNLAPPTNNSKDYISRAEIQGYCTSSIKISHDVAGGVLNLLDLESNIALFWVKDSEVVPYYESAAPFRASLSAWFQVSGYQYLHAAAVGASGGAVVLAGKGGSGKSTTAINCLRAGLDYLGDDYCVTSIEAKPVVYSLYNSAKLDLDASFKFPQIMEALNDSPMIEAEKNLFYLSKQFGDQIQLSLPIRAIFLPRIRNQSETTITPVSAAEALTRLAPSTIFQLPLDGKRAFRFMASLVQRVDCYNLNLGTGFENVPKVIRAFLEQDNVS